jgi:hypothetical protein
VDNGNLIAIKEQYDLLTEVEKHTQLTKKTSSGEYAGACPKCGGSDRFVVNDLGFMCRQCKPVGNGKPWFDVIEFWIFVTGRTFKEVLDDKGLNITPEQITEARLAKVESELQQIKEKQQTQDEALEELRSNQNWLLYEKNLLDSERGIALWEGHGVPAAWHTYFGLGYAPKFYAGESLAIPIRKLDMEVVNIKHRIINPENGRYRNELKGLPQTLYYANPKAGITDRVVVVEGEKKAMISFMHIYNPEIQVVGTGKIINGDLAEELFGASRIDYIPDPDLTKKELIQNIKVLGKERTYYTRTFDKVDDMLRCGDMSGKDLFGLLSTGRRI